MKITWARRITSCTLCTEDIIPHTQRLDDTIRRNGHFVRLHYHPDCYKGYIDNWIESHPLTPLTSHGGRPSLDLSPEQKQERQRLLARLSALKSYYLPRDEKPLLNLQGDISTLTPLDLRRFRNFTTRYNDIVDQLNELGGLPARYGIGLPGVSTQPEPEEVV